MSNTQTVKDSPLALQGELQKLREADIKAAPESVKKIFEESSELNSIFTGRWKEGPRLDSINFLAPNIEEARCKFAKFIQVKDRALTCKVVQIGNVEPFGKDLEREMERIKSRVEA